MNNGSIFGRAGEYATRWPLLVIVIWLAVPIAGGGVPPSNALTVATERRRSATNRNRFSRNGFAASGTHR